VVLDVLRATSTMLTALANGAQAIIPVETIEEALAVHAGHPEALLAGERNGLRIRAEQTGGIDFHLGNSPREFTPDRVRGKTIVSTTTNGTRALRACAKAKRALVAALLNLSATANWIAARQPSALLLVCSGTLEQAAYEDTIAAGALADSLWPLYDQEAVADSAWMARRLYKVVKPNLPLALRNTRNGRRLLAHPELAPDIEFCAQIDLFDFVAALEPDGKIRRLRQ
jgi:2-phosphosulfolactate phosphatase